MISKSDIFWRQFLIMEERGKRKEKKNISIEALFPVSAVQQANLLVNLQQNIFNLKDDNLNLTSTLILDSIYIQKNNIYALADSLVMATYSRAQNINLYVKLTEKLIHSQSSNNALSDLKKEILSFIFKNISANLNINEFGSS